MILIYFTSFFHKSLFAMYKLEWKLQQYRDISINYNNNKNEILLFDVICKKIIFYDQIIKRGVILLFLIYFL